MTIFFFTPTRRLIFCFITVIVSLAVHDGAFAARKFTSIRGVGNVASTATAQALVAAGYSSPPLRPPLSPVSAPSDEADEVTAVTPKTPDQSNDETPAPAPATDAAAKTAAPSWRPSSLRPHQRCRRARPASGGRRTGKKRSPRFPLLRPRRLQAAREGIASRARGRTGGG